MSNLISISVADQIPAELRNTPIGELLEYHNLDKPFGKYDRAQMLIGMCMDNRKHLHIPDNFSFIILGNYQYIRHIYAHNFLE